MNCSKNDKKFLWIKYKGSHDFKPIMVWKFMECSDDFCVRYKCSLCGSETERHFVEWDELLSYGIDNDRIKKIGTLNPFYNEKPLYLNQNS